jgi:hypothetical protein
MNDIPSVSMSVTSAPSVLLPRWADHGLDGDAGQGVNPGRPGRAGRITRDRGSGTEGVTMAVLYRLPGSRSA